MQIKAELAGNLWKIVVHEGQEVRADETLMVLESMKMEIPVNAPAAGRVSKIFAGRGSRINKLPHSQIRQRTTLRLCRAGAQQCCAPTRESFCGFLV